MAEQRPFLKIYPGVREAEGTSFSPAGQSDRSNSDTPELAHERHANTRIPVTPGINAATYQDEHSPGNNDDTSAPSYFTRNPAKQDHRPDFADSTAAATQTLLKGAMTSQEVLRRMSLSLKGRRESLTEIKNAAPDLALSGNVISATFVTPHNITYHKGGEWASEHGIAWKIEQWANTTIGAGISSWPICVVRFVFLSFIRTVTMEPHRCCLDGRDRNVCRPFVTAGYTP